MNALLSASTFLLAISLLCAAVALGESALALADHVRVPGGSRPTSGEAATAGRPGGAVAGEETEFHSALHCVNNMFPSCLCAGWFLLFEFALKKLPPVQEALGLK